MELETTALAKGGTALARDAGGRVVFVEGALAGELVAAGDVEHRRDYSRARVAEVLRASPDRVAPPCPHVAEGCGGCDLQHLRARAQPGAKAAVVADALVRIGRLHDPPPVEVVALPTEGYRTTFRGTARGGRFALRRRHSHDPVVVDGCLVAHPLIAELAEEGRFGDAERVVLRCGARTGQRLVVVGPRAAGVSLPADVVVVGEDELAAGRRAWFFEEVAGRRLRISARSFFQPRPDGAEALVAAVRRAAGSLDGMGRMVDAYGGVGLFAATVPPVGASVVLVERGRDAVADARHNLAGRRARIVRAEVARWRPAPAELVVADPARQGLGRLAADRLAAVGAPRMVLVGCDPAAFARDVELLAGHGYRLAAVTLVDMFGHTSHVEVVGTLVRSPPSDADRGARSDVNGSG